jgi:hypothetical protein
MILYKLLYCIHTGRYCCRWWESARFIDSASQARICENEEKYARGSSLILVWQQDLTAKVARPKVVSLRLCIASVSSGIRAGHQRWDHDWSSGVQF